MIDCVITSMSTTHGGDKVPKALSNRQVKTTDEIIKYLREYGEATTPRPYMNT